MKDRAPLKVCLVAPYPPPSGGISHWTEMLVGHLAGAPGLELSLVDIAPHWRQIFDLTPWKRVLFAIPTTLWVLLKVLWRLLEGCEVIHMTTSGQYALVRDFTILQLARCFRVPVCYHIRFGRIPRMAEDGTGEWRWMARNLRLAHTTVVIDRSTEQTLLRALPGIRLGRLPNFMDLGKLPSPPARGAGERTMAYLGWVIPTKGMEELVQAWSELDLPGWRLEIIGPGDEAYCRDLVERHRPRRLSFEGEMTHASAMERVARADAFVFPSHTEGFPNAVLEAMALGRAIIATDVGAIAEMLEEDAGIVIPPRSVPELKVALARLTTVPGLAETLGGRARARSSRYGIDAVCGTLVALWHDTARPPAPARVCMIAPLPPPYGGIAHWTQMVTEALAGRKDLEILLVDSAPYWKALADRNPVKRIVFGGLRALPIVLKALWRMLRGAQVLHITTSGQFAIFRDLIILLAAALLGRPSFYHLHFGRLPEMAREGNWEWRWMRRALRAAHTVVPIDRATEAVLRAELPSARIVRVPNCISPIEAVEPAPNPTGSLLAVFAGWVVRSKGVEDLVEAWTRLSPPGWRLEIIGPWDPVFVEGLKLRYPLDTIDLPGPCSHEDTLRLLARAEFLVLPSHSEGFPNVILEAMALGKPILGTRVGAVPELVGEDGGVLVEPHAVPELQAALERLTGDAAFREACGRAQLAKVGRYTVDRASATLVSLWTGSLAGRRA